MNVPPAAPASASGDAAFAVALMATALAMGAALAHALELPNKMLLDRDAYFTVQQIYAGWNRLALLLAVEFAGMLAVQTVYRRQAAVARPTVAALLFLAGAQAVFWRWTFPANVATANWTLKPENWLQLRSQWEYSHLAGAGLQILALAALIVAVLVRDRRRTAPDVAAEPAL